MEIINSFLLFANRNTTKILLFFNLLLFILFFFFAFINYNAISYLNNKQADQSDFVDSLATKQVKLQDSMYRVFVALDDDIKNTQSEILKLKNQKHTPVPPT